MTIQFYTQQLGKSKLILHINHVNRSMQNAQKKKSTLSKIYNEKSIILNQVTVLP